MLKPMFFFFFPGRCYYLVGIDGIANVLVFRYRCYYLMLFLWCFCCIDVILQLFVHLRICPMHRCYSAGIMIPVAQMLQCRIIAGLFLVLGWIVINHPIGMAGCISQCFCLMWDCSL